MIQFIKDVLLAVLTPVADILNGVLPDWVLLPNLTFQMPHWIYWTALILFPSLAMVLVQRDKAVRHMGGMWVFPGGKVDAADYPPDGDAYGAALSAAP